MSVYFQKTSLFYDEFTKLTGGGVPYLNGNVNARVRRITNFYTYVAIEHFAAHFYIDVSSGLGGIQMTNQYDNRTFLSQGFKENDSITLAGDVAIAGDYVISDISDDGKTLIVNLTFDPEVYLDDVSAFCTTPVTEIDYLFNVIPNTAGEDYNSTIDPDSVQKFTATGLDASATTTVSAMTIGTKSFAWVTNDVFDEEAGTVNAVTIRGAGIVDYRQYFSITQYFFVPVYYKVSQFDNFKNNIDPPYYAGENSPKYICRVDAKYESGNPVADQTGSDLGMNGTGSWFDSGALGSRPEYTVTSVSYEDNDTSDALERLDVNKNVLVTIVVNSRSGKFTTSDTTPFGTQFILGFNICPSDEAEYQNTPTTAYQNFFVDRCINYNGHTAQNGDAYGTSRQSITDCLCVRDSATQSTITFVFMAGSLLKSYWQSKENNDRYYDIWLITQDKAITTTKATDQVTLKCDFQSADYDTKTTYLFSFVSTGLETFKYPDIGIYPAGSIEGLQGDPFYNRIKFLIPQHADVSDICTVKNILWEVVAEKEGENDFVLEQKKIDLSQAIKIFGVQQLEYSDTRGFISYDGDPCNQVTVMRDDANDTESQSAFIATYGLILRYEEWIGALNQFLYNGTDVVVSDISKQIKDITQDWSAYNNVEEWSLFLRFSIQIDSLENNSQNTYQTQIPIVVNTSDQILWPGASGELTQDLQYFNIDETEELESLIVNGVTLVRATLNGTFPKETNEQYYGLMFATVEGGNIFSRRIASTEIPSESDSPFSPTPTNDAADFSWAYGNLRFNLFDSGQMTVEGYFDSTIFNGAKIDLRYRIGVFKTTASS